VVQHDNEHLTTAQISAYIDKELTPDELAFCNAHLPTCQTCRTLLTDLQFTSSLLHKLPQVAVPRSFVLPAQPTALPQGITSLQRQTPRAYPLWKRSLQAVSTLAALLGLVFVLLGAFTALWIFSSGNYCVVVWSVIHRSASVNSNACSWHFCDATGSSPSRKRRTYREIRHCSAIAHSFPRVASDPRSDSATRTPGSGGAAAAARHRGLPLNSDSQQATLAILIFTHIYGAKSMAASGYFHPDSCQPLLHSLRGQLLRYNKTHDTVFIDKIGHR
jgi:hypothetical protein